MPWLRKQSWRSLPIEDVVEERAEQNRGGCGMIVFQCLRRRQQDLIMSTLPFRAPIDDELRREVETRPVEKERQGAIFLPKADRVGESRREAIALIADLGRYRWLRLKPMSGKRAGDVTIRDFSINIFESALRANAGGWAGE
jgi:hypothetical protein